MSDGEAGQEEFAFRCPACAEENPPGFPACWNCHADLSEFEADAPPSPGMPVAVALQVKPAPAHPLLPFELIVVALLLLAPPIGSAVFYGNTQTNFTIRDALYAVVIDAGRIGLIVYLFARDASWRAATGLRRVRPGPEIAWGLGLFVLMVVVDYAAWALTAAFGLAWYGGHPEPTTAAMWLAPFWLLTGVISEELVFRAYFWTRLTQLSKRPVLALVISAALFSLAHMSTPDHHLMTFLVGLLLGGVFYVRRSLWSLVLAHWIYNLSVYLL